jgi:hypothetical protein
MNCPMMGILTVGNLNQNLNIINLNPNPKEQKRTKGQPSLARGVVPAAAAAFHAVRVKLRFAVKIAVVAPYRKHEAFLYGEHDD